MTLLIKISTGIGQTLGWTMMLGGSIVTILTGNLAVLSLIPVGWFILQSASLSNQRILMQQALKGMGIGDLITHRVDLVDPSSTLHQFVNDHFMRTYSVAYPVAGNDGISGLITLGDVYRIPRNKWESTKVESITNPLDNGAVAHPGEEAWQALRRMDVRHVKHLVVVDDGVVVGVVSREDIVRLLKAGVELEALEMA